VHHAAIADLVQDLSGLLAHRDMVVES